MARSRDGHYILRGTQEQVDWTKAIVFLDRDGVLNEEVHLLQKVADLRLVALAPQAIMKLTDAHHPVFIVTNQTVVARGLITEENERIINQKLLQLLSQSAASVVALYCCLHSEKADIAAYRKTCSWRKPASGILRAIAADHPINLKKSYIVGDQARDVLAGQEVGATTIVVLTGHGGKDALYTAQADHVAGNVLEAASLIVRLEHEGR